MALKLCSERGVAMKRADVPIAIASGLWSVAIGGGQTMIRCEVVASDWRALLWVDVWTKQGVCVT